MIKIVIDQGNSAIKYGIFDKDKLILAETADGPDQNRLREVISDYQPEAAIISSVREPLDLSSLPAFSGRLIVLDNNTPLPFSIGYKTPTTLGRDRLAAVAGAQFQFPEASLLIIDAGTALTYEVLLDGHQYYGGNISPGLNMRFKALNSFTSRLPLVDKQENCPLAGQNTKEAIASGVINGMVFEMEGYRTACLDKWGIDKTIITGGDSDFFARKLKNPIFVNQNLVLVGLNRILEYNV